MRFTAIILGAVLVLGLASARRADACGGGVVSDELVAAALVVGGSYAGVTLGMAIKDVASDDHSVGYGYAEAIIHTPIALAWGAALADNLSADQGYYDSDERTPLILLTALHTALAAHGIYTIAKRRPSRSKDATPSPAPYQGPPGAFQVGRVTASITPTNVQGGAGLGFGGSF